MSSNFRGKQLIEIRQLGLGDAAEVRRWLQTQMKKTDMNLYLCHNAKGVLVYSLASKFVPKN